ncbi:MAG: exonuclease domain-containing protein [Flavobacteriaceae bacterium]|jgi:DNA polymerase-3 subunit epsilon|nr:GIY-YIG nuclease family protein [Flavobacteriaceae bacterium]MBT6127810.1 GIY-YIG nuclease family protein [Flavobacteriaceae bacterium]MDG1028753.1 exonuclease domain-containing protein [Flavobacteriaceae bacterium]
MYAILDIETTGGKYNEEGITEIAIYQHNGQEVTDQFISLVNPERPIQPFVEKLTGINSKMLRNAPRFFEVAKRIIEITENCLIVAHNTDFDYRILRTEFKRLGYNFERNSLCTVSLSQQLLPDMESYKLGKLVRSLGIPISDRHRAQGDALATVKLFELLLEKDSGKEILKSQIKALHTHQVPSKYLSIIEELPNATGVYYLHNTVGDVLYIGKSNNIQKRVRTHLTGTDRKSKKIQKKLHKVNFETTGSELIALLKEQHEIKKNQPQINKDGRYRLYPMGIRIDQETAYHQLILEQVRNSREYLVVFKNSRVAKHVLTQWIEDHQLCFKHSSLQDSEGACFAYKNDQCKGACLEEESTQSYNDRLHQLQDKNNYPHDHFLMIGSGRKDGEYSFIYIDNQCFKGYGFYELNHQIKNKEKILNRMIAMEDNSDCRTLILSHIKKNKFRKLIPLDIADINTH